MEQQLLKRSIEVLKKLRLILQNNLEPQEREMLDEAISNLENAQQTNKKIDAIKILEVIGKVIEKIPAVVEIIKTLLGK